MSGGEDEGGSGREARRGRPVNQLAAEGRPANAGDPHPERLPRGRPRPTAERELDEVPGPESANPLAQLGVVDALPAPHVLDVLDLDGIPHKGSFRVPGPAGRRSVLPRDLRRSPEDVALAV